GNKRVGSRGAREPPRVLFITPGGRLGAGGQKLPADELSAEFSVRSLSAEYRGSFCKPTSAATAAGSHRGQPAGFAARRGAGDAGRRLAANPSVRELPWSCAEWYGAGDSRSAWSARQLCQCAARRVALRHAH